MPDPAADRNLLFGILALQMDFISRDALVAAMNAWVLDKGRPLGQVLVDQGALDADNRAWLEAGVERHLAKHGNDPQRSLAALNPAAPVRRDLMRVPDTDVQASLVNFSTVAPGADPHATRAPTAGAPADPGLRYSILRPHARGGLGEVFVARDEEVCREVALKEIQDRHADHPESRARFLLEAEITGGLEHPGIVPVYGLGTYPDGRPYYAMRFIRGDSLQDAFAAFHKEKAGLAAAERLLRLRQLLGRFVDVCQAVAYAHSRGVLHRDLKPANVMLGKYGETLVVDWGLAKALGRAEGDSAEGTLQPRLSGDSDMTQAGSAVGTPAYMSPEQAAGRLDRLGPASDVYSLGATLYAVLTGRAPFTGGGAGEVLAAVQKGDFPPPRQADPGVPAALEAVCLKAMALKPEDRYPSAQALAQDVERWLADESVSAWREPWRVRAGRWVRRHQTAVTATAAAALVALVLGGGAAFLLERQGAERRAEQARQEASLRQGVEAALAEVTGLEGKGRWGEARAVLDQAARRLGEEGPPDLWARVERARDDVGLVTRLDAVRLSKAAVSEGRLDLAGADRQYAAAFADAGLAREGDAPAAAAGRVRASAVSGPLVAALDDWASCAPDAPRRAWLLEVARQADPDHWRDRARQPVVWRDPIALHKLLTEEEATDQSPPLVVALGARLANLGGDAVAVLRRAQARHPDDFWLNYELGLQLGKGDPAAAAGYYRAALALRPDAAAVRNNLGAVLADQGKSQEAEDAFRAAVRLDPAFALPHNGLGNLLADRGMPKEAEQEYRAAIRLDPGYASPHDNLAALLRAQRRSREAEQEYRAAIRLDPTSGSPHTGLGNLLRLEGRRPEAEQEYRTAIRLDPGVAVAHNNLGAVLREQGKPKEAEDEFRAAIRLDPRYASPHNNLAAVLLARGRRPEAEQEYRAALRLDPRLAAAHFNLGIVLSGGGRRPEAEDEFRAALRLDPGNAYAHADLGLLLRDRGRLEEARKEFQQAVGLGLAGAAAGLRQCERLIPLAARLEAVLRGDDRPADAKEMLAFAELCSQPFERRLRAAARFYGDAFAAEPKLADDWKAGHRYRAAGCAARAGCGQGKDADALGAEEKARLRRQALDWLNADLVSWAKQVQRHQPADRAVVRQTLRHWKEDADLAGVRGDARAHLPEAERAPWKKLWAQVDALLATVSAPETKR